MFFAATPVRFGARGNIVKMQLPTAQQVRRSGDTLIGVTLIAIFLAASLMADLYGVSVVMDNEFSTINQMLIAGGCVMVKAFGLIKMRQAWRDGFWPSAVAMGLLTGLVLVVSITNEMTYYNTNFSSKAKRLDNAVAISSDVAKEKAEIEARIAEAGNLRPIAAIEADIAIGLAKTIKGGRRERSLDQLTKGCSNTRSSAYDQCGNVLALRSELATAIGLTPQLAKDRARLDVIRDAKSWVTTVGETNPGAGFWVRSYNRYMDWRGHGEASHITAQDGQDFLVVVCMLVLQMLNLFLPFAWFYRRSTVPMQVAKDAQPASSVPSTRGLQLATWVTANDNCQLFRAWIVEEMVDRLAAMTAARKSGEEAVDQPPAADEKPASAPAPLGRPLSSNSARKSARQSINRQPVDAKSDDEIERFIDRYCTIGDGLQERSEDLHAAYIASVGRRSIGLRANHFTRRLRQLLKLLPRDETHRDGQKRTVRGILLNAEGRRLLIQKSLSHSISVHQISASS
jgi:hypothetical protein